MIRQSKSTFTWSTIQHARIVTIALLSLVVIAGCSGGESDSEAAGVSHDIDIELFRNSPEMIEVEIGDEIVWSNQDGIVHSVTFADEALGDSGLFEQGETFTLPLTEAGEYEYTCTRHPQMVGTVRVAAD